jgi:hypothetical protein
MRFLERALEEGDSEVHDLVYETIETLSEEIKKRAGRKSRPFGTESLPARVGTIEDSERITGYPEVVPKCL